MIKKIAASKLVEDTDLYPRNRVDETHVSDLVKALAAGKALPPIVADTKFRIVDGYHRRRAHLKHFGPDAVVDVDVRRYATDAEAFKEAVELNAHHGRKLDAHDRTRIINRMRELEFDTQTIALTLHIPEQEVQVYAMRVVIAPSGDAVPAKRGMKHMHGKPVTEEQIKVLQSVRSAEAGRLCLELTRLLDSGLVDLADDVVRDRLGVLAKSIREALKSKAA